MEVNNAELKIQLYFTHSVRELLSAAFDQDHLSAPRFFFTGNDYSGSVLYKVGSQWLRLRYCIYTWCVKDTWQTWIALLVIATIQAHFVACPRVVTFRGQTQTVTLVCKYRILLSLVFGQAAA